MIDIQRLSEATDNLEQNIRLTSDILKDLLIVLQEWNDNLKEMIEDYDQPK